MIEPPVKSPLRDWRKAQGYTLEQGADLFGTTAATLSRVETGHNRVGEALERKIVDETGLSRDQIARPRLERLSRNNAALQGADHTEGVQ